MIQFVCVNEPTQVCATNEYKYHIIDDCIYQFESKISFEKAKETLETQKFWIDSANEFLNQFGYERVTYSSYSEFVKAYSRYIHQIRSYLDQNDPEKVESFLISIQNWIPRFFDRNETKFSDVEL